ncbi:hypothetical protein JCM10212_000818 [Sporobolomyces blumeae]
MLSSLLSLPSTLATSTVGFLSNRRKTFAYLGATAGGAYAVGQWGFGKVLEASERGRKEAGAKNDLLNRFNLNLQDSQFTVLALLPTVASQLQEALDVEDRTMQLGQLAQAERKARMAELERATRNAEQTEERRAESIAMNGEADGTVERGRNGVEGPTTEPVDSGDKILERNGEQGQDSLIATTTNGDAAYPTAEAPAQRVAPSLSKLSLNPDAPAFQPRSFAPASPPQPALNDFPPLSGDAHSSPTPSEATANSTDAPSEEKDDEATKVGSEDGESNGLGKSWAEVVKSNAEGETAANGEAVKVIEEVNEEAEEQAHAATISSNGSAQAADAEQPLNDRSGSVQHESPTVPIKGKAQLWSEIKILSFTRLLTSIYVLSLLTLQTHVQLALLGRAHYVKSLIESLPPRSPSPASIKGKGRQLEEDSVKTMANDEDLEAALYAAKELPQARQVGRVSEEVERKYLTFSWWLLHEGWKVVRHRVEEKVQEVVGPMGLKTPVVYGELSALLGEIRRRVETNDDGSRFDFAAALHPPTPSAELLTLTTGGGFPSPNQALSPTSPLVDPLVPAPLRALLNETSDFLLSPDGTLVLTLLLDRLTSLAVEKLEPAFSTPIAQPSTSHANENGDAAGGRGARFEDVTEKQTRLASLLPVLTRLSASGGDEINPPAHRGVLSGGHGNEFVEALDDVRELREFVAIVYASFDRDNLRAVI